MGSPPSSNQPLMPSVNGQQFIDNALSGFEIKPQKTETPGETSAVDRTNLQYQPELAPHRYSWESQTPFQADSSDETKRYTRIRNTVTQNPQRKTWLQSLGFDPDQDVDLSAAIADDFITAPQVKA